MGVHQADKQTKKSNKNSMMSKEKNEGMMAHISSVELAPFHEYP
jgi:hypothetical protein